MLLLKNLSCKGLDMPLLFTAIAYSAEFFIHTIKAHCLNTMRPRQNGCHFPDDILKRIFLDKYQFNVSLKFVPKVPDDDSSTGSDNGLALARRQAIIWTNDG